MALKACTAVGTAHKMVICGTMLLSLVSCAVRKPSPIEVGDGGFLTGNPCSPPCFWGIIPGQATEADVIKILQEKSVYDACETWDYRSSGGEKGINCDSFVIAFTDADVVQGVAFAPSLEITAQDIIAKYGEPEWVAIYVAGVHIFTFSVHIAYPHLCAIVVFPSQERLPYILKPSTKAESIGYDIEFCAYSYYETNPYWKKWQGYGEYWPYNFPTPTPGMR